MKKIIITTIILILFLCCSPFESEITKEECLKPYVEEYGEIKNELVIEYYPDNSIRKISVEWDVYIEYIPVVLPEYYTKVIVIIWYNKEKDRVEYNYGWNVLEGPYFY